MWPMVANRFTGFQYGAAMLTLAGCLVRVVAWLRAGSLNSDELYIAVNLRRHSFYELAGALDYDQLAPLGWLWLEKTVYLVAPTDAALRTPALVAGCAVVPLAALLARTLLTTPFALVATALVAGSPLLIYQSTQIKPYTVEATAAILLIYSAMRVLSTHASRRSVWVFWGAGAGAVFLATTAIFVIAGAGGLLLLFAIADRRWDRLRHHLWAAGPTVVAVGVARSLAGPVAPWVYDFWSTSYPYSLAPRPFGPRAWWTWSGDLAEGFAASALWVPTPAWVVPLLVLTALGTLALGVRSRRRAWLLCAPLGMGYLLALLRLYPMGTRVATWLVPTVLILVAAAGDAGRHLQRLIPPPLGTPRRGRRTSIARTAVALPVVLVLGYAFGPSWGRPAPVPNAVRYAIAEDAIRHIAENQRDGDLVYVQKSSAPLAIWYGPSTGLRFNGIFGTAQGQHCASEQADRAVTGVAGARRVWLLSRAFGPDRKAAIDAVRTTMDQYGSKSSERRYGVFIVLLYRVAPAATMDSGRARPPTGESRCLLVSPASG